MNLLTLDTETTGLPLHPAAPDSAQPRLIEFAGVVVNDKGKRLRELVFLCNPHRPLEPIITKITGLTDEVLASEPDFSEFVDELIHFFEGVDVMAAHNAPFDSFILWLALRRCERLQDWTWPPQVICTAQTYTEIYGRRPKLTRLYEDVMGRPYEQTHRALDDVDALVDIILKENMLETLPSIKSKDRVYVPQELRAIGDNC